MLLVPTLCSFSVLCFLALILPPPLPPCPPFPVADWLLRGEIQKLIVVITGAESKAVLERWVFNVETDKSVRADG